MRRAVLAYAGLLAYGSLYPFQWAPRGEPLFGFLLNPGTAYVNRGDMVQNVLVYMPLGLLLAAWWSDRHRYWTGLLLAVAAGTLFSMAAEVLQEWLPARVSSAADVAMNAVGTLAGALLAGLLRRDTLSGARLQGWRDGWFEQGAMANTGLVVVALWLLAHLSPLIPVVSVAQWRHGLAPLYWQLHGAARISLPALFCMMCNFCALGLMLRALVRPGLRWWRLYGALLAAVLIGQLAIEGRHLSLEEAAGAVAALPLLACLSRLPLPRAVCCAIGLLALAMTVSQAAPAPGLWGHNPFNWVPFRGHMRSLQGFTNILDFLWPFMAMAWLARQAAPPRRHHAMAVGGGAAVALCMFGLEWLQLHLPGRSADITQVLLACAGWAVPWLVDEWMLAHQVPGAA